MNVLVDAPDMQEATNRHGLTALIRSPLAMGLLSGKYGAGDTVSGDDIRATTNLVIRYFEDAWANPMFLNQMNKVRELLMSDGRSLVQGAICWLWAKGDHNIPIPGARRVDHVTGVAGALAFGPLPDTVMVEIEQLIERDAIDTNAEGER